MIIKNQHQINEEIRDKELRLIGEDGQMLGIMSAKAALELAEQADLDLVKISPNAVPPVCKIMDYGKFKFELLKRQKEAKKNQKVVEVKEIWLSMTIDVGDLNVKAKQTLKFLAEGNKVKVSIRMRGRQNAHADLGIAVMQKFADMLGSAAVIEKKPLTENRNILMIVAPNTSKS
ncbi:MAG: translation initiation factor IF-3 [Clostridia bacterium]|nr:translation initiation factor IF-3 [Clostridia bacterium]